LLSLVAAQVGDKTVLFWHDTVVILYRAGVCLSRSVKLTLDKTTPSSVGFVAVLDFILILGLVFCIVQG